VNARYLLTDWGRKELGHCHWHPFTAPSQATRGSASPQGEARRERAAKPKQSAGRGRHAAHSRESDTRTTGGGGRAV